MSREVLYVGMDESNHGETKSRIGEIIVATCSYNERFWESKKHPNKRDYSRVRETIGKGVNYLYTILPHEMANRNYSNLPLVAPFFVKNLLILKNASKVRLGLDGKIQKEDKEKLMGIFAEEGINVNIFDFPKRNRIHYGPELIHLSHIIANRLIQRLLEFAEDENYIPFNVLDKPTYL